MALDGAAFGATNTPPQEPARRRKARFLAFPFIFLFRLLKRSLAGVLRTVAYHPVSSLLVLLLAGAGGFLGYQDYNSGGLPLTGGQVSAASTSGIAPSPAAEDFIKGQTTFDASLMWSSFSDNFKQQLSSRGTSQQSLQQQLDQRKQAGAKVDQVLYGGGTPTPEGTKVYLYVLTMQAPNNQGEAETHYVLTVDQTGKIVNVE